VVLPSPRTSARHGIWLAADGSCGEGAEKIKAILWGPAVRISLSVEHLGPDETLIWAPVEPHEERWTADVAPRAGLVKALGLTGGKGAAPPCIFSGWEPFWGFAAFEEVERKEDWIPDATVSHATP
jgi:hypothetical protein